jgi:cell wall-associated NlpC family hydrolase
MRAPALRLFEFCPTTAEVSSMRHAKHHCIHRLARSPRAGSLALALCCSLAGACASTGAIPQPFPTPGSPTSAPPPAAPGAAPLDTYALTRTALSLRGVPYRNGGRDQQGFDCSGFIQYVFAQNGLQLPRDVREQYQLGRRVRSEDIAPGDLLFFATTPRKVTHVGIAIDADQFVHAPSSKGVVRVERLSQPYWSRRFLAAKRVQ